MRRIPELVMARETRSAPLGRGAQGDGGQGHLVGGKRALGVTAGVPPRVEAGTKVGSCWTSSTAPSRRRLEQQRGLARCSSSTTGGAAAGSTAARRGPPRRQHCRRRRRRCMPSPPTERRAIVELFERLGRHRRRLPQARPPRLLREPGLGVTVDAVSRSSSPGACSARPPAARTRRRRRPLPDWIEWKRHQIWIYDITHFPRAGRVAYAILDVVTRKWLATLVTAEETATQVEVVFTRSPRHRGPVARASRPAKPTEPAEATTATTATRSRSCWSMSDNGPQMRAGTTREFLGPLLHRGPLRPPRHPD